MPTDSADLSCRHPARVHVVAGVLGDARGRILLARRVKGRELAGLWEFPGGKVESDETPQAALVRELREELGIEAEVGAALIRVPHLTSTRARLCLDVYRIAHWRGIPTGREGQALTWTQPEKLPRHAMPAPDRPVVAALMQPDHYFITPAPGADDAAWLAQVESAVSAHAITRVQVRLPGVERSRQRSLLAALLARPALRGIQVLVNGEMELADEVAAGLHLRSAQLHDPALRQALARWPGTRTLAASCHTLADLERAEELGCRFAVLGPVRPTASHPDVPGIGWDGFAALREHSALPIYALGGLTLADLPAARQHGAQGIAAIRGLLAGADTRAI